MHRKNEFNPTSNPKYVILRHICAVELAHLRALVKRSIFHCFVKTQTVLMTWLQLPTNYKHKKCLCWPSIH